MMTSLIKKDAFDIPDISDLLVKKIVFGNRLIFSPIDGEIVNLVTKQVFKIPSVSSRLFVCLLYAANKIITKEQLIKKVWGDYGFVVSSNSVNQAIWALREKLEAAEPGTRYIRTIPRIGFCFVGETEFIEA